MFLDVRTVREIMEFSPGSVDKLLLFERSKWVSKDSLLTNLEETILKGNIAGGGFSSALWISDLKNRLEEAD